MVRLFSVTALVVLVAAPAWAQSAGTTSGPAAGTPTTLGTGSQTGATSHQAETVRNRGGAAVTNETQGQAGGNGSSIRPGVNGAESGSNPAPGQRSQSR